MTAEPGGQRIDDFIDGVLASGGSDETSAPPRRPRRGFDWAWLLFPAMAMLLSRGVLRAALGISYVAAPLVAVALLLLDWWQARRARR
jgi:hypothetical protein